MSEDIPEYKVGSDSTMTLKQIAKLNCARQFADPRYEPPTPDQVDALIKAAGWSQTQAAKIVGVNFDPDKGSPTIRRWRAPVTSSEHRDIPYSAWRLMLITAGVLSG